MKRRDWVVAALRGVNLLDFLDRATGDFGLVGLSQKGAVERFAQALEAGFPNHKELV